MKLWWAGVIATFCVALTFSFVGTSITSMSVEQVIACSVGLAFVGVIGSVAARRKHD